MKENYILSVKTIVAAIKMPVSQLRIHGGGRASVNWSISDLAIYPTDKVLPSTGKFQLMSYDTKTALLHDTQNLYQVELPLNVLASRVSFSTLQLLCQKHSISVRKRNVAKEVYVNALYEHRCEVCPAYVCHFKWMTLASSECSRNRRAVIQRDSENKNTIKVRKQQ